MNFQNLIVASRNADGGQLRELKDDGAGEQATLNRRQRFLLSLAGINPRKAAKLPEEVWLLTLPAIVMLVVIPLSALGVAHFVSRLSGNHWVGAAAWVLVVTALLIIDSALLRALREVREARWTVKFSIVGPRLAFIGSICFLTASLFIVGTMPDRIEAERKLIRQESPVLHSRRAEIDQRMAEIKARLDLTTKQMEKTGTSENLKEDLLAEVKNGNNVRKPGFGPEASKIGQAFNEAKAKEDENFNTLNARSQELTNQLSALGAEKDKLLEPKADLSEEFKALWRTIRNDAVIAWLVLMMYLVLLFFDLIPVTLELFRGSDAYDDYIWREKTGREIGREALKQMIEEMKQLTARAFESRFREGGETVGMMPEVVTQTPLPDTGDVTVEAAQSFAEPSAQADENHDRQKQPAKKSKKKKSQEPILDRLVRDLRKRGCIIYTKEGSPRDGMPKEMLLRHSEHKNQEVDLRFVDFSTNSTEAQRMKKEYEQVGRKLVLIEEAKLAQSYTAQFRRIMMAFYRATPAPLPARQASIVGLSSKAKRTSMIRKPAHGRVTKVGGQAGGRVATQRKSG